MLYWCWSCNASFKALNDPRKRFSRLERVLMSSSLMDFMMIHLHSTLKVLQCKRLFSYLVFLFRFPLQISRHSKIKIHFLEKENDLRYYSKSCFLKIKWGVSAVRKIILSFLSIKFRFLAPFTYFCLVLSKNILKFDPFSRNKS